MPNRIIRESITTSESWNQLSPAGESFCVRLITVVDDYGRMHADADILRAKCFPRKLGKVTDKMIAGWLEEITKAEIVLAYAQEGRPYLVFRNWAKYQNTRAKESKFPAPPDHLSALVSRCDQMPANVPVTRISDSDLVTREPKALDEPPVIPLAKGDAQKTGIELWNGPEASSRKRRNEPVQLLVTKPAAPAEPGTVPLAFAAYADRSAS